ncbi:hypothetical protein L7F22_010651 [Adiantum nelumboides]|nr:hypothetical protein [Adiantum nelumboides]
MEDVAPRRRRTQRSPTPTKWKRSPHSPHRRESKREEKSSRKKKERKRSPSSQSSSPSSFSDKGSGYSSQEKQRRGHRRSYAAWKRSSKLKKFKEGGKNISFLTYDGTFGATYKVLTFIQQFDAAFGDEGFTVSSKLRHVAMHFQKSARQWWASLRANGEAPKTRKALRASIMKQFLASGAKDKVLTKWRSLKLSPYESIHKYVDKFWDLHLKATVYKKIDFEEQKQQFCAGLPEDMNEYVNSQRPRSIFAVIHHTMVAARINFQQGAKRNLKPMEAKNKQEYKGKNPSQSSSKSNSNNNKAKEKGVFKGKNKLTPKELECYRKENKCFKCGEQRHSYRSCPQRNNCNEQPRASMVEAPKEDVHCKGSPLSYAWGKVREHDTFILFDPASTHNFISLELATRLGVQDFEMGDAMKADGAFINQEVSVTPLIGKLRLHIQGYVDKEDFFISPLKHEDVILGAPWFDRLAASIKFPERKTSFKFREKDMYINARESGSTIPPVNDQAFDKSIKIRPLSRSLNAFPRGGTPPMALHEALINGLSSSAPLNPIPMPLGSQGSRSPLKFPQEQGFPFTRPITSGTFRSPRPSLLHARGGRGPPYSNPGSGTYHHNGTSFSTQSFVEAIRGPPDRYFNHLFCTGNQNGSGMSENPRDSQGFDWGFSALGDNNDMQYQKDPPHGSPADLHEEFNKEIQHESNQDNKEKEDNADIESITINDVASCCSCVCRAIPDVPSDIIVEVDGVTYALHKFPLISRCGLLRMLVADEKEETSRVELEGVPGGAEGFELAAKFCYGACLEISKYNIALLRCVAEFLDMSEEHGEDNLVSQTEAYLERLGKQTLKDIVATLTTCEKLLPLAEELKIVSRCIDWASVKAVQEKDSHHQSLVTFHEYQHDSSKVHIDWWVEDLSVLRIDFYQRVLAAMRVRGLRTEGIGGALVYYAHQSLKGLTKKNLGLWDPTIENIMKVHDTTTAMEHEQRILVETIVSLLPREKQVVSVNFLIGLLRTAFYSLNRLCMLHQAHPSLTDIDLKKLCRLLDFQKLSQEACAHAAQNERLPVQAVVQVLFLEQLRIRNVMAGAACHSFVDMPDSYIINNNNDNNNQGLNLNASQNGHVDGRLNGATPAGGAYQKDHYASVRRENRELKLEVARMKMRLGDLEKEHLSMKQDMERAHPSRTHQHHHGFLHAVSKSISKLNPFHHQHKLNHHQLLAHHQRKSISQPEPHRKAYSVSSGSSKASRKDRLSVS